MEAFNYKFVCNLHDGDLCYLAAITRFLFSQKIFIALIKSTRYPARMHVPSLLRCISSWKIYGLDNDTPNGDIGINDNNDEL